jgi:hypothetical protein
VVSVTPRPRFTPEKGPLVPIVQEVTAQTCGLREKARKNEKGEGRERKTVRKKRRRNERMEEEMTE